MAFFAFAFDGKTSVTTSFVQVFEELGVRFENSKNYHMPHATPLLNV